MGNTRLYVPVHCRPACSVPRIFEKAQHVILPDEWQSDRHGIFVRKVTAMGFGGSKIGAGAGTVRHERYNVCLLKWMATFA
eukprot:scaffold58163_cov53-Phaeocystis_antarctica.AAC.1